MSGNVISINGGPDGQPEPDESVIKILEDLLERARAGDAIGIAAVYTTPDEISAYCLGGWVGSYSMIGAVETMKGRLVVLGQLDE